MSQARSSTGESPPSTEEQLATFLKHLERLLPSVHLALVSMHGKDGSRFPTVLIDTLTRLLDTLPKKERAILSTLIVNWLSRHTPHGMPSHDSN